MPIAPQAIWTGRLASVRPMPPGSGLEVGFWRRGSGQRLASPTNETTSTIAAAHQNSHSGTGRSVRTEMPWAISNTRRSAGLDGQLAEQRVPALVLGLVALDLEDALDVGGELEGGGLPRRDRLLDLVAVQMHVVGRIGAHDDRHLVALRHLYVGGTARDLTALDLDAVDGGLRGNGLMGLLVRVGVRPAAAFRCGRRGLRRLVAAVAAAARDRDHDGHHGDDRSRHQQPNALVSGHGGGEVWLRRALAAEGAGANRMRSAVRLLRVRRELVGGRDGSRHRAAPEGRLERGGLVWAARALGLEAVAHAEVGVDIAPVGRRRLELQAHLADEHVHRAVP